MNARELRQYQQRHVISCYVQKDMSHLWCVKFRARLLSMYNSNLCGANFREANLGGVSFRYANLRDADFSGAILMYADFRSAEFSDTRFVGADLSGATGRYEC